MRLLYDNKVKDAILTPSSENANYSASNLKDPRLSRHLRFTGDEDEYLLVDSGGLLKDIFQATINLLENSNDLTLWPTQDVTVTASGLFYDGFEFAKVTNSGATAGYIFQDEPGLFTTLTPSGNIICRKGSTAGNTARLAIWNSSTGAWAYLGDIDFDNYPNSPGTPANGKLRWYRWIDSQILELHYTCSALTALTDDIRLMLYASPNTTAGEYTYWMRPQLEDLPYDTPYVNGSRAAVNPNYTFEMPKKFIFKVKVGPRFIYNTDSAKRFFVWRLDDTRRFDCYFDQSTDKIIIVWINGIEARTLYSEQFDDSAPNDINSKIIIYGQIDLSTRAGNNAFFCIVDGIKQAEDNDWRGIPDGIWTSIFDTLSVGHYNEGSHADSQFESVQFWAWDGSDLGTLSSEADIDAALKDKPPIFEQIYQPKIKASYAALAGHNLSADALVKVQGNDWNSWNGPPFEQALVWNADIILKNFTEKEYPYWRFLLDNPNNDDDYIKLGLAYLGTYLTMPYIEPGVEMPRRTVSVKTKSGSGQIYGRKGYRYYSFTVNYPPFIDSDERDAIDQMFAQVLNVEPLFVLLWENSLDVFPPLYCTIVEPELPWKKSDEGRYWGLSISFEEVF